VASDIRSKGLQADAFACHIGRLEQITNLTRRIADRYGRLDILVNNAGTNIFYGLAGDTTPEAFSKIMEVNFNGAFFLSQQAVPLMEAAGGGVIVNVSSINGLTPGKYQATYSAAKAAVISMTKSFAVEYADRNIRSNALCPGMVRTRLSEGIMQDKLAMESLKARWPLNRVSDPDEMVCAVLFLASPASGFMTGQVLVIDGGATAQLL
jgi:NAD(P)-dependent dehydrogenase (short-subunit alcohol dehydrogenase family)